MKTMNFLLAIALLFMVGSCSKETAVENEELAAVDYRSRINKELETPKEIIEMELHKYYIIDQLAKLDFERKLLEEQIDGGRKDLIPKLELTMKHFADFENQMIDIQERLCHILGTIADELAEKASGGDKEAEKKLLKMDESLKECGIEVSYTLYEAVGVHYASIPKTTTVGGCSHPKYYKSCDIPLLAGMQKILVHDRLQSLIITTDKGDIISKAEYIGKSETIEGFYEYALEVPSSTNAEISIEVSKKNGKYRVPIKASEGY